VMLTDPSGLERIKLIPDKSGTGRCAWICKFKGRNVVFPFRCGLTREREEAFSLAHRTCITGIEPPPRKPPGFDKDVCPPPKPTCEQDCLYNYLDVIAALQIAAIACALTSGGTATAVCWAGYVWGQKMAYSDYQRCLRACKNK
jgi:hypothetical protein